jgi:starch phosphorylase
MSTTATISEVGSPEVKTAAESLPVNTSPEPVKAGFDLTGRTIAYFSMEIALSPDLPTYSGGLGMLAGDTLRSAADTEAPMLAVSLVHRKGYFRQKLDANGQQTETAVPWSPETLPSAGETVEIVMQGRRVRIRAWRFDVVGVSGHVIPVFLLDTDVEGNDPWDRRLPVWRRYLLPALPGDGSGHRRRRAAEGAGRRAGGLPHE